MQRAFTLVQITDPHLHSSSDGTLLGMNTENSLKLILEQIKLEVPRIDLIIATGDISQDSSVGAYENFIKFTSTLNAPVRWVPGNHDSPENMTTAANGSDISDIVTVVGDWVVIMLDSSVSKKVYGSLDQAQLSLLKDALERHADKYALIGFHHHPISMHSEWIDKIGVKNSTEFRNVIAPYKNIRAIVCGHVHQESDSMIDGFRYISTPSTCVQFAPKSEDFGIDSAGPGFRTLTLNPDGTLDTQVSRIDGVDFKIDYSQKGY